jgi:hypothetical protein
MNTLDVIKEIITENEVISQLTFSRYPEQTLIQNTMDVAEEDLDLISSALEIRRKYSLPFWDSLMLSSFDRDNVSIEILSRALHHNANVEKIKTKDISKIEKIINENENEKMSINSEVELKDGSVKHLFMLDFHLFPSENNLKIIVKILTVLNLHGYLLISGESYHFISKDLYESDAIIDLLSKSLFFSPIVDRAWIAHQLLERSCSIRVGKKHGIIPTVLKRI